MLGTQRNFLPAKIEDARNLLEKLSVPEIFVARKEMLGDLDDFDADANLASRPNLYSRYQKAF